LDVDRFVEEAFKIDARLRYLAVVDDGFHVLISKMRPGVESLTPDEVQKNFEQLVTPLVMDALAKLEPYLGELYSATLRYRKLLLLLYKQGNRIIVTSFEPEVGDTYIKVVLNKLAHLTSEHLGFLQRLPRPKHDTPPGEKQS
jgi:hypothetical protein